MAPLVTPAMLAVDPTLARLTPLSNSVQWMNGIQFYLTRDVPITHGHIIFIDSPWALTAVSQRQFWTEMDFADWGDGKTRGILSVDISQWDAPGFNGKAADRLHPRRDRRRGLGADEAQPERRRPGGCCATRTCITGSSTPTSWTTPTIPGRREDVEPLLVNNANTWRLRPDAATAIPNFALASDYVRTHTDLATMEGANEAARRAVNAILDRSGSQAARCQIWNLHEPEALAPLRAYDRARYAAGLPWDDRFPKAIEAALAIAQSATGITAGGAGPLSVLAPLTNALSVPGMPRGFGAGAGAGHDRPAAGIMQAVSAKLPGLDGGVPGAGLASALRARWRRRPRRPRAAGAAAGLPSGCCGPPRGAGSASRRKADG